MKRLLVAIVVFAIASVTGANAQEVSIMSDLTKHLVQALPKDVINRLKKELMEEVAKQMVADVKKELTSGKQPIELAELLAQTGKPEISHQNFDTVHAMTVLGKQMLTQRPADPAVHRPAQNASDTAAADQLARGELVSIVTNPKNPVRVLTVDQLRKVFSGEYTNWSQVGGPDMEIKVFTWQESTGKIEDMLKATLTPKAARVRYVSLIIPYVDRVKGGVGFLPTQNMEQLNFLLGHESLRKIAVKNDENSQPVMPSRFTLADGSYPMVPNRTTNSNSGVIPAISQDQKPVMLTTR
ncbi:substrate-binding domain-containing protein [Desulfomonile tiedjei]|uniref:PBP domain-containing protein n=1 Tax=Desulfomonile tiedjei (strain ATCC 49306 / DSM 6799 / DCB-1) TaxID=706587 RepID=I4C5T7_DESTA|nr:substrate-binding domain-containing protein [Desulfomonile tiedjei]AFM24928.1 hypothetical protein Desti_2237 [Desulfomonile tiedjei DSM 6799]